LRLDFGSRLGGIGRHVFFTDFTYFTNPRSDDAELRKLGFTEGQNLTIEPASSFSISPSVKYSRVRCSLFLPRPRLTVGN